MSFNCQQVSRPTVRMYAPQTCYPRRALCVWYQPLSPFHGICNDLVASQDRKLVTCAQDVVAQQPERFFVAEILREKIFLQYSQEVPYCTAASVHYPHLSDSYPSLTLLTASGCCSRSRRAGAGNPVPALALPWALLHPVSTSTRKRDAFLPAQDYMSSAARAGLSVHPAQLCLVASCSPGVAW